MHGCNSSHQKHIVATQEVPEVNEDASDKTSCAQQAYLVLMHAVMQMVFGAVKLQLQILPSGRFFHLRVSSQSDGCRVHCSVTYGFCIGFFYLTQLCQLLATLAACCLLASICVECRRQPTTCC